MHHFVGEIQEKRIYRSLTLRKEGQPVKIREMSFGM